MNVKDAPFEYMNAEVTQFPDAEECYRFTGSGDEC
jgi:hypothetical protein